MLEFLLILSCLFNPDANLDKVTTVLLLILGLLDNCSFNNSNVDISNRLNVNGIAFDGLRQDLNVLNNENSLVVAVGTSTSKIAYSKDFGKYIQKWSNNDPDIRKQLGPFY